MVDGPWNGLPYIRQLPTSVVNEHSALSVSQILTATLCWQQLCFDKLDYLRYPMVTIGLELGFPATCCTKFCLTVSRATRGGQLQDFFPGRGEQRGWIRLSGERKCPLLPMPAGAHWVTRWSETAWSYGYWFWHSTGVWQTDRLTRRS